MSPTQNKITWRKTFFKKKCSRQHVVLCQAVCLGLADSCTTSADCDKDECCVSLALLDGRRRRQMGSFAVCRSLGQAHARKLLFFFLLLLLFLGVCVCERERERVCEWVCVCVCFPRSKITDTSNVTGVPMEYSRIIKSPCQINSKVNTADASDWIHLCGKGHNFLWREGWRGI